MPIAKQQKGASNSLSQLFILLFLLAAGLASADEIVATFSEQSSGRFQHLVVDGKSGLVYVGGVNRLYQLSADFERPMIIKTGPKYGIDNINKVLVIDDGNRRLIACGSYKGSCSSINLKNISEVIESDKTVVADTLEASTFAFIAPGPPNLSDSTNVLYIGVTHTNPEVPAVSSRSLRGMEYAGIQATKIFLEPKVGSQIRYVFGFSSNGFSYFLTTQKTNMAANSPFISKLIRVCQKDPHYDSYTEVPLECATGNGTIYHLAQAASLGKPGADLAAELGTGTHDEVLYTVFAQSVDGEGMSNAPSDRSALCVYSLQSMQQKFKENIENCFLRGKGDHGLDYIKGHEPIPCWQTVQNINITEDYCGSGVKALLGGKIPVTQRPVYTTDNILLTAVTSTWIANSTVVFFGTSNGHLKKVRVQNINKSGPSTFEYEDIKVDESNPILSDLTFDPKRKHVYAMTERKVIKILLQTPQNNGNGPMNSKTVNDLVVVSRQPKGIPSGGILISFSEGKNLTSFHQSKMFVHYENVDYWSSCQILSNTQMECRTPNITIGERQIDPKDPLSLDYGLLVGNIVSWQSTKFPNFFLYPNPVYDKFDEEVKYHQGHYLTINGKNLNLACQENDVSITIGDVPCNVSSISQNQLKCHLPTTQPTDTDLIHNVTVIVGQNLRYEIGKISYGLPSNNSGIIVGLIACALVLLVAIGVFIACKRKSAKDSRNLQQIQGTTKAKNNKSKNMKNAFPQADKLLKGNSKKINHQLPMEDQTELIPYDKRWEFPEHRLRLGIQLGAGCFGRVLKAEAVGIKGAKEIKKTVAVKMARSQTNVAGLEALVSELKIMIYLGSHLNVLNLLGACTVNISKGELLIIIEYCRFGNLQTYLLNNRKDFVNQLDEFGNMKTDDEAEGYIAIKQEEPPVSLLKDKDGYLIPRSSKEENPLESELTTLLDSRLSELNSCSIISECANSTETKKNALESPTRNAEEPESFWRYKQDPDDNTRNHPTSTNDLISWSFQISRGMNYLANRKVFHGDLAARNVLLADNGVVKVADFGLARKIYYESNYQKKGEGPMPIKWMAIETLTDHTFSSQSDVWSYGIVLWELFSLAKAPYPGISNRQVVEELQKGYRLEKPEFAPNAFYEIMRNCWQLDPKERPTFGQLEDTIRKQMEESVSAFYFNLNVPFSEANKEASNASATGRLGLAKWLEGLNNRSKIEKTRSLTPADVRYTPSPELINIEGRRMSN